jgi:hypothetical protein
MRALGTLDEQGEPSMRTSRKLDARQARSLLLCVLLLLGLASRSESAPIHFSPAGSTVEVGDIFTVGIDIGLLDPGVADDISDLYAFQFGIGFDAGLLQAIGSSEGDFLSSAGSTLFLPGFIDNTLGRISFNAGSLIGAVPGATGRGRLFTIQFLALAAGVSPLELLFDPESGDGLFDSALSPLAATVVNGAVNVTEAAAVPEPGSVAVLTLGVLSAFLRRRQLARTSDF